MSNYYLKIDLRDLQQEFELNKLIYINHKNFDPHHAISCALLRGTSYRRRELNYYFKRRCTECGRIYTFCRINVCPRCGSRDFTKYIMRVPCNWDYEFSACFDWYFSPESIAIPRLELFFFLIFIRTRMDEKIESSLPQLKDRLRNHKEILIRVTDLLSRGYNYSDISEFLGITKTNLRTHIKPRIKKFYREYSGN